MMNKPHITFWIISVIALIWNLMGIAAFIGDMSVTPESLTEMAPEIKSFYENNPLWNKIAYGLAVIAGTLGSLSLLLRRAWAIPLFILSLLSVLINNVYTFILSGATEYMTGTQASIPIMVTIIAVFLWYYSKKCFKRNWIN